MEPFYEALGLERAEEIATLTQTMYEAREHRCRILALYDADDEARLLELVRERIAASQSEHPLYEHYLAALILEQNRLGARNTVNTLLSRHAGTPPEDALPLQLELHRQLLEHADLLCGPPQLRQDSLLLPLRDQIVMTVFYASHQQYAFRWKSAVQEESPTLGIDTAAGHAGLPKDARNHLHTRTGQIQPDLITHPEKPPLDNILAVVRAITHDTDLQ